jgi:hypothetical protein
MINKLKPQWRLETKFVFFHALNDLKCITFHSQ